MKLGTLLLRDGVINLDQLEAALRAQVLFGGRLGTNLVELGHLSLDQLTEYLARTLGLPAALQEDFEQADARAISLLPVALAEKHVALALRVEPGEPSRLHVAMSNPRDVAAVDELVRTTGSLIVPCVAPELRIYFYLERHYGVVRKARYLRVAPAGGTSGRGEEPERRRHLPGALAAPAQGSVSIQPRRSTNPGMIVAPAPPVAPPVVAERPDPARPASPTPTVTNTSLTATLVALEQATSREAIADAILGFCRPRLEATLVFVLRDGVALGWRGFVPGLGHTHYETVSLPLSAPSCLATAYEYRMPWRGAPGGGGSIDHELFQRLRLGSPPAEVLTVPVQIGQRVVNLVYAHASGGAVLDEGVVDGLITVADAAGDAYTRLIQQKRGQ